MYLRRATVTSALSAAQASGDALRADNAPGLTVTSAVFANVTVAGEEVEAGTTPPSTAVVRRNVWVVTVHSPKPIRLQACGGTTAATTSGTSADSCPTETVRNDVLILDAITGAVLYGFFY
jgi:hypothetical protein